MGLFNTEHNEFRRRMRQFVESRVATQVNHWEERRELPRHLFKEMGHMGLLGLMRAPAYGGSALDFGYNVVLFEELVRAKVFGLVLSVVAQTTFFSPTIEKIGTREQKERFLIPAIRGESIGALAVTEPSGGSDIVHAIQCQAVQQGDDWIISGEKKYITNAPIADFIVLLARSKNEISTSSFSLIIVPTDLPGLKVRTLDKLGLHTSPTGLVVFDQCIVPKNLTLGKPGLGFFYVSEALLQERLIASLVAVAVADLVLLDTIHYLQNRRVYDTTLSKLQAVRHKVSEMAAEVEMARRFVYSLCESYRDGKVEAKEICMAKFQVVDIAQRVVERCLQLHGGYGFLEENWISRAYRDIRVLSVGGGASELMKDLVAGYLRL